jgi:tetratricopeptide (TPR) repeat protein
VVPNGPGTSTPLGRAAAASSAAVTRAGLSSAVLALAKERDASPENAGANRALGIALYKLSKYDEAQPLLDKARQLDPTDGVAALYAGLTAEQLKDYPAARAAYNDYIRNGKTDKVRSDIQSRLVLIAKMELKALAKDAVSNEKRIGQVLSDPNTVAVLPLRFTGPDASLAPLERGLADLIITDLARSGKLKVVERDQMQAIAEENETDYDLIVKSLVDSNYRGGIACEYVWIKGWDCNRVDNVSETVLTRDYFKDSLRRVYQ